MAITVSTSRGSLEKRLTRRWSASTIAIVVVLVICSAVTLLPFAWMLSAAFRTQGDLTSHPFTLIPSKVTFANFAAIWTQIPFARQLGNTVIYSGVVTIVSVIFDSMAGYALARFNFKGRTVIFIVIVVTLMVPFQATIIPLFQQLSDLGWINTYQGLIVPHLTDAFGIFFMRQFFLALPKDLEDAARIDGANEFTIWARIMMPLAEPAILTIALFNLLANWNDLLWPLIVTTSTDMQTLAAGLALFKGQHITNYGVLMAGSLVALLPMVIIFLFVQRRFVDGIATTGIK
jgi:multiple sugar transport system permease protein